MQTMFKWSEISNIKNLSELPEELANAMRASRKVYANGLCRNSSYEYCVVNEDCTRFFSASRTNGWDGHKSYGNTWHITYGSINWKWEKNPLGMYEPEWCKGKTFAKAANGTEIPAYVGTKREVIEIAKAIGIFNI